MRSYLTRPNLPPQQSSEHQVKIGGQIRLACTSGGRMSAHHERGPPGKAGEPPAHQLPEPSLYPVAHYRRANRTANYKAYLRLSVLGYGTGSRKHRCGQGRTARPAARAHHALELLRAPHPRLLRQHDPSSEVRCNWPAAPPTSRRSRIGGSGGSGVGGCPPQSTAGCGKVPAGHRTRRTASSPRTGTAGIRESDRRSLNTLRPHAHLPAVDNQTASCSRPLRRRAARTARPARVRIRSRKPWTFARRRLFGWNVRLLTGTPGLREDVLNQGHTCRTPRPGTCLTPGKAALQARHGSAC
jgi:hypothetical protein